MSKQKGFITKLAGAIDSILPSNNSISTLNKKQYREKYGEWNDIVTVVLYTIEGIKAQDPNFLIADQPTYITKFTFYPQDKASKKHLLRILNNHIKNSDSQHEDGLNANMYADEEYRYQFRRMIDGNNYQNLYIAPDMVIEISDEEVVGDGRIDNIINAGLFDYTHSLTMNKADNNLDSYGASANQPPVGEANTYSQQPSYQQNPHYNTSRHINQATQQNISQNTTQNVNHNISNNISHSFSHPNHDINADISLKCTIHDASGNRNYTINKFPCKIGKSSTNDIVINGKFVSREHVTIGYVNGQFYIQDRSSNHSFLTNQQHAVSKVLAGSDTILLTGKTVLLLGGQSSRFAEHPQLIFHIAESNQAEKSLNNIAKATPLNSSDNFDKQEEDLIPVNLNNIINQQTNTPAKQSLNDQTASKLGGVTKLAPLFKLNINSANGVQTYKISTLPWTIGRAGTKSLITVADIHKTSISRQHITLTDYDDLEQIITVTVDGRNGASLEDVNTGQLQKYRQGECFNIAIGQSVRVGLDKPAITFSISVDDDCL